MIRNAAFRALFLAALSLLVAAAGAAPEEPAPGAILTVAAVDGGARQPSAAVDGKGGVHIAFVAGGKVLVASCPPGAAAFGEPRVIASAPDVACGMRRGPRLVACGDDLVAAWIEAHFDSATKKMSGSRNLVASRSADGGATWSKPARVNRTEAACGEGLHALAAGPGKTVYAAWLQPLRPGKKGTCIRLARSDDGGATWPMENSVYDPPSGTVCECCHPTVAVAGDGTVAVMFRNSMGGARDMYLTISPDGGMTFSMAAKLGKGTWKVPACPMDGGAAAFGEGGALVTAWRREVHAFLARGEGAGGEEDLGEGDQPWVGGVPGKASCVAWCIPDGGIRVRASVGDPPVDYRREGARLLDPVVAGSSSGTVFLAWESSPAAGGPARVEGAFLRRPAGPR